MLENLKNEVYEANLELVRRNLVILTWGNVSGIDRESGLIVIKPSGVAYDKLRISDMAVVDLTGKTVEGLKPSSDLPTHLELYRSFPNVGGIVHTHSTYATIFSQACKEIPSLGTTHADTFNRAVLVTRKLTDGEIENDYEANTGKVIAEAFKFHKINYEYTPAVLVARHAPFTWGKTPEEAVETAQILEQVAQMALMTHILAPNLQQIEKALQDRHFNRKHGENAYYGQN